MRKELLVASTLDSAIAIIGSKRDHRAVMRHERHLFPRHALHRLANVRAQYFFGLHLHIVEEPVRRFKLGGIPQSLRETGIGFLSDAFSKPKKPEVSPLVT
ncbi:MAG TPA: hypothetical protein VGF76_26800 [Polyangiaceae bacterium]